MDELTAALETIRAVALKQYLLQQAMRSCRVSLVNSAADDRELGLPELRGWPLERIEVRFHRQALIFTHGLLSYPFFSTELGLYVADPTGHHHMGMKPIGSYRLISELNGELNDDYLVIDEPGVVA